MLASRPCFEHTIPSRLSTMIAPYGRQRVPHPPYRGYSGQLQSVEDKIISKVVSDVITQPGSFSRRQQSCSLEPAWHCLPVLVPVTPKRSTSRDGPPSRAHSWKWRQTVNRGTTKWFSTSAIWITSIIDSAWSKVSKGQLRLNPNTGQRLKPTQKFTYWRLEPNSSLPKSPGSHSTG